MVQKKIENLAVISVVADGQYCPAQASNLNELHINLEVNSVKGDDLTAEYLRFLLK